MDEEERKSLRGQVTCFHNGGATAMVCFQFPAVVSTSLSVQKGKYSRMTTPGLPLIYPPMRSPSGETAGGRHSVWVHCTGTVAFCQG